MTSCPPSSEEECFCPLRCRSIALIVVYLSSTREKPLRRDRCRWSNEITLSQFCQSRKALLVLCPPCVAVVWNFRSGSGRYLSISTSDLKSVGLVPAFSRISEKLSHKLAHGCFGEGSWAAKLLPASPNSSFFFSNICLAPALSLGPLKIYP